MNNRILRILIVEDEDIIRYGLEHAIDWKLMDCMVIGTAKDGVEGLEKISELSPDIVLTDIRMPKMSGLQMVEQALSEQEFQSIILTSYSEFELAQQAFHVGVADYLLKPVDERELHNVMEKVRRRIEDTDKLKQLDKGQDTGSETEWEPYLIARKSRDPYVKEVCRIIQERYAEKLNVNQIADELGISVSLLSRHLKSVLDTSFVDLLTDYRIKQAIKLLEEGTLRISEISELLGYSDYKYFSSVFKKQMGVGPSEYRKS